MPSTKKAPSPVDPVDRPVMSVSCDRAPPEMDSRIGDRTRICSDLLTFQVENASRIWITE